MQYLLLIYIDPALMDALPEGQADAMLRSCFDHADGLKEEGHLLESQMLEPAATAKSMRVRRGRVTTTDGPFAETHEQLGGFFLLECKDLDEALHWAEKIPHAKYGSVEVRPLWDQI